ncbi:class I SAM-dependent methyltransferase [Methanonatronarchaeum sp. AMET-Sl]|uniref:class I SAM-dependent methyltransferase n=1 Tax=Methanonatronarchaeum sp. AMET-Sl TaxID=3037654 RepID=UPI00244E2DE5|nr:class I SAM-dependent methyltransferase [Methanonatronarchaeum sp. AMET-Sl]WGI17339.1 class I SAM-dependent methyltransferase [Methanonatronarchaeum sp. AMET-Sl]
MNKDREFDESEWNERYKKGRHRREDPSPFLSKKIEKLTTGNALDIACGAGRNSIYLAEKGYQVDAIDLSSEALKIAQKRAREKKVEVNWIHTDVLKYDIESEKYDLITLSYFHIKDENQIQKIINGLKKGGYLIWESHIKADIEIDIGPETDEVRYERGQLLSLLKPLTVIEYIEKIEETIQGKRAIVKVLARKK